MLAVVGNAIVQAQTPPPTFQLPAPTGKLPIGNLPSLLTRGDPQPIAGLTVRELRKP